MRYPPRYTPGPQERKESTTGRKDDPSGQGAAIRMIARDVMAVALCVVRMLFPIPL